MNYILKYVLFVSLLSLLSCGETTTVPVKKQMKVRVTNIAKYTAVKKNGTDKFVKGNFDETHMMQLTYFHENGQLDKKYWYDKNRKPIFVLEVKLNSNGKDSIGVIKNDKLAIQSRIKYRLNSEGKKIEEEYYSSKGDLTKTLKFQYNSEGNLVKEIQSNKDRNIRLVTNYKLNEYGDPISMESAVPDGSYSLNEDYTYTAFNEYGDWTQKQVISDGIVTHLINRQVNYHEEKKK